MLNMCKYSCINIHYIKCTQYIETMLHAHIKSITHVHRVHICTYTHITHMSYIFVCLHTPTQLLTC